MDFPDGAFDPVFILLHKWKAPLSVGILHAVSCAQGFIHSIGTRWAGVRPAGERLPWILTGEKDEQSFCNINFITPGILANPPCRMAMRRDLSVIS